MKWRNFLLILAVCVPVTAVISHRVAMETVAEVPEWTLKFDVIDDAYLGESRTHHTTRIIQKRADGVFSERFEPFNGDNNTMISSHSRVIYTDDLLEMQHTELRALDPADGPAQRVNCADMEPGEEIAGFATRIDSYERKCAPDIEDCPMTVMSIWRAPRLNCAPLKTELVKDGVLIHEQRLVEMAEHVKYPQFFEVPKHYRGATVEEMKRTLPLVMIEKGLAEPPRVKPLDSVQ